MIKHLNGQVKGFCLESLRSEGEVGALENSKAADLAFGSVSFFPTGFLLWGNKRLQFLLLLPDEGLLWFGQILVEKFLSV